MTVTVAESLSYEYLARYVLDGDEENSVHASAPGAVLNCAGLEMEDDLHSLAFINAMGADLSITKTVTGDLGDRTKAFTFTVGGLPAGRTFTWRSYIQNGSDWTAAETGTLSAEENTFTLAHGRKIVIETLPLNEELTFTEDNEYYTTTWRLDSEEETGGSSKTVTLTANAELAVTNDLKAVSPTGLSFRVVPYVLLLALGLCLIPVLPAGRRRRKEEG